MFIPPNKPSVCRWALCWVAPFASFNGTSPKVYSKLVNWEGVTIAWTISSRWVRRSWMKSMSSKPRIPSNVSCSSSAVYQRWQNIDLPDASDLRIVWSWSSRSRGSLNVSNRATNSSHFLHLVPSGRFNTSGARFSRTWLQSQHPSAGYLCARLLDHPSTAMYDHPIVSSSWRQNRACRIDTSVQYPVEYARQEFQVCIRSYPRTNLLVNDTESEFVYRGGGVVVPRGDCFWNT